MKASSYSFDRTSDSTLNQPFAGTLEGTFEGSPNQSLGRKSINRRGFGVGFVSGLATGLLFSIATIVGLGFLLVVLNGSTLEAAIATDEITHPGPTPTRPIGEIRRDLRAFVKNSKQDDDLSLQVGAVVDLCSLHREIVVDSRYETNVQLQGFRAQIASRLKRYQKDLEVTMVRRARKAQKHLLGAIKKGSGDELLADSGSANSAGTNLPSGDDDQEDSADDRYWDEIMNGSMYEMGGIVGGPSQVFGYLGGNFAPPWDYGEDLVRLIESTISPASWRRNGGEGSIQYYRPSRIIVVSATTQVQDDITDMLRKMRWLSR